MYWSPLWVVVSLTVAIAFVVLVIALIVTLFKRGG